MTPLRRVLILRPSVTTAEDDSHWGRPRPLLLSPRSPLPTEKIDGQARERSGVEMIGSPSSLPVGGGTERSALGDGRGSPSRDVRIEGVGANRSRECGSFIRGAASPFHRCPREDAGPGGRATPRMDGGWDSDAWTSGGRLVGLDQAVPSSSWWVGGASRDLREDSPGTPRGSTPPVSDEQGARSARHH